MAASQAQFSRTGHCLHRPGFHLAKLLHSQKMSELAAVQTVLGVLPHRPQSSTMALHQSAAQLLHLHGELIDYHMWVFTGRCEQLQCYAGAQSSYIVSNILQKCAGILFPGASLYRSNPSFAAPWLKNPINVSSSSNASSAKQVCRSLERLTRDG